MNKNKQTLDEYMFSKQYTDDVKALSRKYPTKANWGGITKDGYTRHTTVSGLTVSIPVSMKNNE